MLKKSYTSGSSHIRPLIKTPPPQGQSKSAQIAGNKPGVSPLKDEIAALNTAGDTAFLRITPELKANGKLKIFKVGGKTQLGSRISVTRDSDKPNSSYTVRYEKQALGVATGEVGTGAAGRKLPAGANLKAELGGQTTDAVEMRFDTAAEAEQAVETLGRLQRADMINDSVDLIGAALKPQVLPVLPTGEMAPGVSDAAANPLTQKGAPGSISNGLAGLEDGELAQLRSHITAVETTIGSRARLAVEVKGDLKLIEGALEGRLDGGQRITRRVELPTADQDGKLSYTLDGGLRLSAKERGNRKVKNHLGGMFTMKADNRLELARARVGVTLDYRLPKGSEMTHVSGDRPAPELDTLSDGKGLELTGITVENRLDWQTQGLLDPTRGDISRLTERFHISDPAKLGAAADQFFGGDLRGAAKTAGVEVTAELAGIRRDGYDMQPGGKLDLGVGGVEGSVILSRGVDDITGLRAVTYAPGAEPTPAATGEMIPPSPQNDGKTLRVLPHEGISVRSAPDAERVGVVQNGSFMRDQGGRQVDAEGREWTEVAGTGLNDEPVKGWVRSDLLTQHSAATGAMNETGRINPTAEYNRMDAITVQDYDNLWDLSQRHGWDYQATLAANKDHLQNPSLIFKGDTVYVPGTAKGPKPVPVPTEPTQQVSSSSSATKGSGSSSSGTKGATSGNSITNEADSASVKTHSEGPRPKIAPLGASDALPEAISGPSVSGSGSSLSASGSKPVQQPTAPNPAPTKDVPAADAKRLPADTLEQYQVEADSMTTWTPKAINNVTRNVGSAGAHIAGWITGEDYGKQFDDALAKASGRQMPASEAAALDELGPLEQLAWGKMSKATMDDARDAFQKPADFKGIIPQWSNDGHVDAFRHALWNARMTSAFGESWAHRYATSHERLEGNPAPREAMDLYNNAQGRAIAKANPNASDEELKQLVREAVDRGDLIVIDRNMKLQPANAVPLGEHGFVPEGWEALPGNPEQAAPPLQLTGS